MTAPNLFLIYVQDAEWSTDFYRALLDIEPVFTSPRYVAFEVAPGVLLALWTGRSEHAVPATPRTSEVGLMLPGPAAEIDALHERWVAQGVRSAEPPTAAGFGRTFVVADPDGNLIRVSPVD